MEICNGLPKFLGILFLNLMASSSTAMALNPVRYELFQRGFTIKPQSCFSPQPRKAVLATLHMVETPISKIVILPDSRVQDPSSTWHKWLAGELQNKGVEDTGVYWLPNPYDFNTKRYEVQWLGYMRSQLQLADNPDQTLVVAHGFAADAVLRYLENHRLAKVLLLGPHDMYHAGERHGRDLVWPLIIQNVKQVALLYGNRDKFVTMNEAENVKRRLNVQDVFFKQVEDEDNFFDNLVLEDSLEMCTKLLSSNL
mmetsp:Transcript_28125/g.36855  ORF Transcript_28125/g.36855 Transcript_28125/m.36855 type:complete len:254 (-) Transcript_28125:319-1080(-)